MGQFPSALGRSMRRLFPATAVAVMALLAGAFALLAQQQPTFRLKVQLVRMLVTVKDQGGQNIGGMKREDFHIFDNGVKQEVALFERHTDQPLSIALLVDTSLSTMKELRYEIDSVQRFFRALLREGNPDDAVALFSFNYQVEMLSTFSRRLDRLEQSMRGLKPVGGTSMYDAIYFASRELESRDGRKVIVVVTDGGDTTSGKTYHEALQAAHLTDAAIYSILVMPITNDAGRNIGGENALTTLAQSTGGRVFAPSLGNELDSAFDDILRDLRTQYLLGFYPRNVPPTKERFHRLEVKVDKPHLRVISRNGYYGESE
jgi:Ca-activated chloride channel homolog